MTLAASHSLVLATPLPELQMRLRVLIADDEQLSRERLKRFLQNEPETEIVAECASGTEAVSAIQQQAPDVAFLDVRMPELDAFGVIEALKGARLPAIILVTAYDHFALRAFEFHAVDYLLKPFNRGRLQVAVRRARHRLQLDLARSSEPAQPAPKPELGLPVKPLERVTVKSSGRLTILKTADIDWISSAERAYEAYVRCSSCTGASAGSYSCEH
jgi:two-component system LytT family response regulator